MQIFYPHTCGLSTHADPVRWFCNITRNITVFCNLYCTSWNHPLFKIHPISSAHCHLGVVLSIVYEKIHVHILRRYYIIRFVISCYIPVVMSMCWCLICMFLLLRLYVANVMDISTWPVCDTLCITGVTGFRTCICNMLVFGVMLCYRVCTTQHIHIYTVHCFIHYDDVFLFNIDFTDVGIGRA